MAEIKTLRASIIELLPDENKEHANAYAVYCQSVLDATDSSGKKKNPWMAHQHPQKLAEAFQLIRAQGLVFDGKHITWQSTGISLDYVAYKNKMLLVYPDTKMDISVVYKADEFSVSKDSGKVEYTHKTGNPFGNTDADIIGAYSVIKNERGEFLTLLTADELKKHRAVAKTDFIWRAWFKEMVMKTVIKKAVKYHFDDVFVGIEKTDNDNYDLSLLPEKTDADHLDKMQMLREQIDLLESVEDLTVFYQKHKGIGRDFDAYIAKRKNELQGA